MKNKLLILFTLTFIGSLQANLATDTQNAIDAFNRNKTTATAGAALTAIEKYMKKTGDNSFIGSVEDITEFLSKRSTELDTVKRQTSGTGTINANLQNKLDRIESSITSIFKSNATSTDGIVRLLTTDLREASGYFKQKLDPPLDKDIKGGTAYFTSGERNLTNLIKKIEAKSGTSVPWKEKYFDRLETWLIAPPQNQPALNGTQDDRALVNQVEVLINKAKGGGTTTTQYIDENSNDILTALREEFKDQRKKTNSQFIPLIDGFFDKVDEKVSIGNNDFGTWQSKVFEELDKAKSGSSGSGTLDPNKEAAVNTLEALRGKFQAGTGTPDNVKDFATKISSAFDEWATEGAYPIKDHPFDDWNLSIKRDLRTATKVYTQLTGLNGFTYDTKKSVEQNNKEALKLINSGSGLTPAQEKELQEFETTKWAVTVYGGGLDVSRLTNLQSNDKIAEALGLKGASLENAKKQAVIQGLHYGDYDSMHEAVHELAINAQIAQHNATVEAMKVLVDGWTKVSSTTDSSQVRFEGITYQTSGVTKETILKAAASLQGTINALVTEAEELKGKRSGGDPKIKTFANSTNPSEGPVINKTEFKVAVIEI